MSQRIELSGDSSRRELALLTQRYLDLHQRRLRRIQDDLREHQRDLLTLIPLLLHINHPLLPGYVSSDAPSGIIGFDPDPALIRVAKGRFRGFNYQKRAHARFCIRGLYAMGSGGTMAYSRRSDIDFWVCHDPDLTPAELEHLNAKFNRLEMHAAEYSLEIHFFPMHLEKFRRGETQALSKESSGSTQHILLLEEFYRTAVYIAGGYPLWWLEPPELELSKTPGNFSKSLLDRRLIDPDAYLDFGCLSQIPPDEFFGSAHWQLFKGIDSPYKALLKILLIEAYAVEYPAIRWLCNDIKAAVSDGVTDLDALDSYVLMYRRAESYLRARNDQERLKLAQRCFYFKVDRPLLGQCGRCLNWQTQRLQQLTNEWGWDQATLQSLDSRKLWKAQQVMQERDILVKELSRSYRILVDFARNYGDSAKINPVELKLLGRKLYAALEKRPGKIDSINPGISGDVSESLMCLVREGSRWQLWVGEWQRGQNQKSQPLKQSQNLIELLVWAQINGIFSPQTRLISHVEGHPNQMELQGLRGAIAKQFPDKSAFKAPIRALGRQPRMTQCNLFINTDSEPLSQDSRGRLVSDRFDPLSFSTKRICLIQNIDQLISTTWGEVLTYRHLGAEGLLACLINYLQMSVGIDSARHAPAIEAICMDEHYGQAIGRRLSDLFSFIGHIFGPDGPGANSRYILPLGELYYIIQRQQETYLWQQASSYGHVLRALSEPKEIFSPVVPDPQVFTNTPLPTICAKRDPGRLQLFFFIREKQVEIYIMDEYGSIFHQVLVGTEPQFLLARQHRFLTSILQLRGLTSNQSMQDLLNEPPRYFQIKRYEDNQWSTRPVAPPAKELDADFMQLRLIGTPVDGGDNSTVLACDDLEFNSAEYGDDLFEVIVRHILERRKEHKDYPIYLTGIEPRSLLVGKEKSTIVLLRYKRQIEQRLNAALKTLLQAT